MPINLHPSLLSPSIPREHQILVFSVLFEDEI